jgi:hypothetical protein
MVNEHKDISELFGVQRQQNGKSKKKKLNNIEKEILERFNSSSNNFDIDFEDESGNDKIVKYEMTVLNRKKK